MFGWIFTLLTPKIVKGILKYVFEENELDVKCNELERKVRDCEQKNTDNGFRITAMKDVLKGLGEDQHSPVIDLEEWEQVKADMKKIRNKGVFKKL